MGVIDPVVYVEQPRPTSVSILRCPEANPNNYLIQSAINGQDPHGELHLHNALRDGNDLWTLEHELKKVNNLREIMEWTSNRIGVELDIHEFQIRRQANRDCYTHDFKHPERRGAFAANVITVQDPTLGQVRFMKHFMRYALAQRFIILYSDRSRLDDYIEDLGFNYESCDEDSATLTNNAKRKVYLANEKDEDAVEAVVQKTLESLAV